MSRKSRLCFGKENAGGRKKTVRPRAAAVNYLPRYLGMYLLTILGFENRRTCDAPRQTQLSSYGWAFIINHSHHPLIISQPWGVSVVIAHGFGFGFPVFGPYYPFYAPPVVVAPPPVVYAQPPVAYGYGYGAPVPYAYTPPGYAAAPRCFAGAYICPLDRPGVVGGPCSCPTNTGRAPGRVG